LYPEQQSIRFLKDKNKIIHGNSRKCAKDNKITTRILCTNEDEMLDRSFVDKNSIWMNKIHFLNDWEHHVFITDKGITLVWNNVFPVDKDLKNVNKRIIMITFIIFLLHLNATKKLLLWIY